MTKKWYFKYDPKTFEFIPGAILSEEQPENTTDIEPSGVMNPVWNSSTNSWTGQSLNDWLNSQKENTGKPVDQTQQQISQQAIQVMQDNAKLTARVKELEAKEGNNV